MFLLRLINVGVVSVKYMRYLPHVIHTPTGRTGCFSLFIFPRAVSPLKENPTYGCVLRFGNGKSLDGYVLFLLDSPR